MVKKNKKVRCIVFTAFRRQPNNDLVTGIQQTSQQQQWQNQLEPYSKCTDIDLIYIFINDGYEALVSGKIPFIALMIEERMRMVLKAAAVAVGISNRVQIVGTKELVSTLSNLQAITEIEKEELNELLLGGGKHLYYDSPKFVEAIIRLARGSHIKSDELIFRFDEDVSVNPKGIGELKKFHIQLPNGMDKQKYWFSSGNYRFHKPVDLLNDFAIRTQFFASVGAKRLSPGNPGYKEAKCWLDSIAKIGADPYNQVISGAGLNMSYHSISVLPPFANADTLIIWIDDHLKRRLHEALGHLPAPTKANYCKSPRCCATANFEQDRYPGRVGLKDIEWAKDYLPRLVRGIVIDNLIWNRKNKKGGVYTNYVRAVIDKKTIPDEGPFKKALKRDAFKALDTVIQMWSDGKYKGYKVYEYASKITPAEKQKLFEEAVETCYSYLKILKIWNSFVILIGKMGPDEPHNRWLFRKK